MEPEKLRKRLGECPEGPGVYFLKDAEGRVLYIGKAKNLRHRVSSYFQHSAPHPPRIRKMLEQLAGIEFLEADSEVDALLLEARMVRDIQPKYNVNLKDGKSFVCIAVSTGEEFPRVTIARETDALQPSQAKGAGGSLGGNLKPVFYGPFTSAGDLRTALKVLQRVFRFRTCSLDIREEEERWKHYRPCILYNIRMCTAPCNFRIDRKDYLESIRHFRKMLSGKKKALLEELGQQMKEASARRLYERAAVYRDQIRALENLTEHADLGDFASTMIVPMDPKESVAGLRNLLGLAKVPRVVEGIDISNISGTDSVGSLVRFVDGVPFKAGYRRYKIKTVEHPDDTSMLAEVVHRRFRRLAEEEEVFPDILLVDGGRGHLHAALEEIRKLALEPPLVVALSKYEGDHLFVAGSAAALDVDRAHPGFRLLQYVRDEAHRFAQLYHHILRRKRTFVH